MSARLKKASRKSHHHMMMAAFRQFLKGYGADSPVEGEQRWRDMFDAFKAGWNAA